MKTLDDLVREHLGVLTLQVLTLMAENAQLKASLDSLPKPEKRDS